MTLFSETSLTLFLLHSVFTVMSILFTLKCRRNMALAPLIINIFKCSKRAQNNALCTDLYDFQTFISIDLQKRYATFLIHQSNIFHTFLCMSILRIPKNVFFVHSVYIMLSFLFAIRCHRNIVQIHVFA